MNDLSWFLYLADVLPNLASSLGLTSAVLAIGGGFGLIWWYIGSFVDKDVVPVPKPLFAVWFPAALIALACSLVPSKETIYLIAGSEAGEAVVTSEQGQEVLSDIQEIIKAQLNNLKDSGSE